MTSRRLREEVPVLALAGAVVALFGTAVLGRGVFFERDVGSYWYPQVATLVRVVTSGAWPVWDPDEGFGVPLLADPSSQVFYPTTWLNLLLLPPAVYAVLVVVHTFWAGAGTYRLARRWGLGQLAATASAWTWCASGPFLSAATLYHHFCGAAWMPWLLLAGERLLEERTPAAAARLALTAGAQALAGSAEMCTFSILAFLLRAVEWAIERRPGRERRRAARALLLAGAVAAAVAAAQWLPTAALLASTSRARFQAGDNLYWSVAPRTMLDFLVPGFTTDLPLSEAARAQIFDGREPFLANLYLGGVAALACCGLARGRLARRGALLALVFLLLALGRHFPPGTAILTTFPLRLFRYPAKYLLPASLFWSLLVGCGLEAWRQPWQAAARRRALRMAALAGALALVALAAAVAAGHAPLELARRLGANEQFLPVASAIAASKLFRAAALAAVAGILLVAALLHPRLRNPAAIALSVVLAADLFANGRRVNLLGPPELAAEVSPALSMMGPRDGDYRLLSSEEDMVFLNAHFTRGVAGWPPAWSWALGMQQRLSPPTGARWGLRGSYDADYTGLANPALPLLSGVVQGGRAPALARRLLRLGNVGTVVTLRGDLPGLVPEGEFLTVFDVPVRVQRVPDPLPAVYVAGGIRPAADPMAALRIIARPDFEPGRDVTVPGSGLERPAPAGFRGTVTVLDHRADRIVVDAEASHPGYVVFVEAYEKRWQARVDGLPAAVVPVNLLFRGVRVPAGRHRVELAYRPASVTAGLAASLAGLAAAGVLLRRGRGSRIPS